eukprot:ANDGO_03132.mRNA.1 U3 snoRNP-associated protein-like EMB2271
MMRKRGQSSSHHKSHSTTHQSHSHSQSQGHGRLKKRSKVDEILGSDDESAGGASKRFKHRALQSQQGSQPSDAVSALSALGVDAKEDEKERRARIGKAYLASSDRFFSKKSFSHPQQHENGDAEEEQDQVEGEDDEVDMGKGRKNNKHQQRQRVRIETDLDGELADDIFFSATSGTSAVNGGDAEAQRIRERILLRKGKVTRLYSDTVTRIADSDVVFRRGHTSTCSGVALTEDARSFFSVGKDGSLLHWDSERFSASRDASPAHHDGVKRLVLPIANMQNKSSGKAGGLRGLGIATCVAVCPTEPHLVCVGSTDGVIRIVDTRLPSTSSTASAVVSELRGHRGGVCALAFRPGSADLYSGSLDRSIKVWSVSNAAYMQTLYGHAAGVHALDVLNSNASGGGGTGSGDGRCLSGGGDASVRLWRLAEETQLQFDAPQPVASIDALAFFNETRFVAAGQARSVQLWSVAKRRPLDSIPNVHFESQLGEQNKRNEGWIASVACLRGSDLVATGSDDGWLRFHRVDAQKDRIVQDVHRIAVDGWINSIAFARDGRFAVAATGKEHRLGRWEVCKRAKAGIALVPLVKLDDSNSDDE